VRLTIVRPSSSTFVVIQPPGTPVRGSRTREISEVLHRIRWISPRHREPSKIVGDFLARASQFSPAHQIWASPVIVPSRFVGTERRRVCVGRGVALRGVPRISAGCQVIITRVRRSIPGMEVGHGVSRNCRAAKTCRACARERARREPRWWARSVALARNEALPTLRTRSLCRFGHNGGGRRGAPTPVVSVRKCRRVFPLRVVIARPSR
jgi:hypothetical protein